MELAPVLSEAAALQFGSRPRAEVRACLDAATRASSADDAEAKLLEALDLDRDCLATYFALYKFYFYRRRLDAAEKAAREAIAAAARAGGFDADWRSLTSESADWSALEGPERCMLFSLKALAFIRLRCGDRRECEAILAKLGAIDPRDQVGAGVIRGIAEATASFKARAFSS